MRRTILAMSILPALSLSCDLPSNQNRSADGLTEAPESTRAPALAPTFRVIAGQDIFAMVVPSTMPADQMAAAAREHCGPRQFCQVNGWTNEGDSARALPMTDREVSTLAFKYAHNRETGFEQRLWNCDHWPRSNPDECLSRE